MYIHTNIITVAHVAGQNAHGEFVVALVPPLEPSRWDAGDV